MYVSIRELPGPNREKFRVEFRQQLTARPTVLLISGTDRLRSVLTDRGKMRTKEVARLIGTLDGNASAVAVSEFCDLDDGELRTLVRGLRDEELLEDAQHEDPTKTVK